MFQLATALLIALTAICVGWYALFFCYLRPYRCNVPGPLPLPLVGCWPYLIWPRRTTLEPTDRKPIECYWLGVFGTQPIIFVCDPDLIREIATDRRDDIHDRGMRDAVAVLAGKSKDSILTSRGQLWKRQRSAILPELNSSEFLDHYFDRCNQELDSSLDSLSNSSGSYKSATLEADEGSSSVPTTCPFGHSVDASEIMYQNMATLGAEAMFGFRDPANDERYFHVGSEGQRMDRFTSYWSILASMPLLPLNLWRRIASGPVVGRLTNHAEMESMPEDHCDYVRREMDRTAYSHHQTPMLKALLQLRNEEVDAGDSVEIANKRVVANVVGLMNGASKNEAAKVCYALTQLALQPEMQTRLHDEITEHLGVDSPRSRQVLASIPYLNAVVNEILRLNPAFPVTAKIVERKTTLGGYRLGHGAEVAIRNFSLQTHPDYWDQPYTFCPERHLDRDNEPHPYTFIPFGVGRRRCPGSTLACMGIGLTLCRIIQRFEVALPLDRSIPPKRLSMTISYRDVTRLRFAERTSACSSRRSKDSQCEPTKSTH